ncbi:uncharacterized protein C4H3.14c-like [Belonocnema kinseyi]|uniref:uncharacterized protein C4H3.14c-like n=1 Tax=Belonocnema kinseyi TaxID=2817044 RepID=UPI00143D3E2A|nr:uncharacterized protein C4H3.14c-like [Belonocnema kinseyi]
MDLEGKAKGNISLPERLQPPNIEEDDYLLNEEKKVMIMNMQKALYEIKIADLEKRAKRLEDRNEFVHDECKATDFLIKIKDTETAKEIAELERELSSETKKLEADNEEIEKIKQLSLKDKEEHEKNMKSMQERYEKTRSSLVSKMKILNAKINTLEDFKTVKEAFEQKLKENDQVIKENEEKLKSTLEQIDRKFKIAREKMKNDLYDQILNLASDFQTEISKELSLPIHRLIRENIAIQNEINQIVNETSVLADEKTSEFEYSKEIYNEQIDENRKKTIRRIITCKVQACLVSDLKISHSKMKKRLSGAKINSQYSEKDKEVIFEEVKKQESKLDFRRRELEVHLHQIHIRVNSALNKKRQFKYTIKKLKQILYDVKFAASCALKIFQVNEEIEKMTYNQLLLYLLDKITKNKSENWIKPINSKRTRASVKKYIKADHKIDWKEAGKK